MTKQHWFNLHSWLGIKLAIFLCFILITGTLAVVSHEIDWLANSAKRVLPLPTSADINWPLIYQQAKIQSPNDTVYIISAPIDPWFAVEVIQLDQDHKRYRQYFHPITAHYQGDGRWYNWQRFFRMAHRHLMLPTKVGITLVCIMALFLLGSMISGTVIYPTWWQGFFRKPRTNNKRVLWNDLHRLFGLWSLWLLAIICITSVWYLIELWGGRASFPITSKPTSTLAQQQAVQPGVDILKDAITQTLIQHADLAIKNIRLPSKKNQGITINGQAGTLLVRDRATNAVFDPVNGDLLSIRTAQQLSVHVRISEAADPLHFGVFAGIYSKLIYFIFGSVLCALSITGTYLYGLHYTRVKRHQVIKEKYFWQAAWRGMHKWRWLSITLLTLCAILTLSLFTDLYSQTI